MGRGMPGQPFQGQRDLDQFLTLAILFTQLLKLRLLFDSLFQGDPQHTGNQFGDLVNRITSYNVCYTKLLRSFYWANQFLIEPCTLQAIFSNSFYLNKLFKRSKLLTFPFLHIFFSSVLATPLVDLTR